jgi:hypothetical protein
MLFHKRDTGPSTTLHIVASIGFQQPRIGVLQGRRQESISLLVPSLPVDLRNILGFSADSSEIALAS